MTGFSASRYYYNPPDSHLTGEHVFFCMVLMLFFHRNGTEWRMSTLHTAPSYLSGDVNKNEKHKSNLDAQVV